MQLGKSLLVAAGLALGLSASAQAATITSSDFDLAYGFVGGTWNDTETAGTNTATSIGDFSFTPTVAGTQFSTTGPSFASRVFASGGGGFGVSWNQEFTLDITGTYTGATPGDASGTPNEQVILEITKLNIWATGWSGDFSENGWWEETTSGRTGTSSSVTLSDSNSIEIAGTYSNLDWDPGDLAIAGLTDTRNFVITGDITNTNGEQRVVIDGLKVHLVYDAVPEPASAALMGVGGLLLMFRRRWA